VPAFHGSDGLGVKIGHHAASDDSKSVSFLLFHIVLLEIRV
jgi:hypothetical protein